MPINRHRVLRGLLMLSCTCVGFGLFMIGLRLPFMVILVSFGLAWKKARTVVSSGWTHGTATMTDLRTLVRHKMLGDDGLILGASGIASRPSPKQGIAALWSSSLSAESACFLFLSALVGRRLGAERMIRINTFVHLATFAKTGGGKGVSVLVPNLLSYPYSCVVTDPKGELYILTSGVRRDKLGNQIFRLDPFGVCGPNVPASDRFNPLDFIDDKDEDFLDQCRDLADMMIMQSQKDIEPYWNDSARGVLCAFIAYVCACEHDPAMRTIDLVRDLLSSRDSYNSAIQAMQKVKSHGGVIERLGGSLTWHVEKELASVLSNVQRHTEAFDSPAVARNLRDSTFDPRILRSGRATIYLCLPHDKIETLAPLMRLWIGVILRTITKGTPSEKNPVLFMLDEAAHLGKIRVLEQAFTLMRGMGIRLWVFFQSQHQLTECFGDKAKTILDNIDTQQYFAINDYDNAEALSKKIGEATITVTSRGGNTGRSWATGGGKDQSGSQSAGRNISHSDAGRRLIRPEEILNLPEDVALVFHKNLPVIPTRLIKYYNHPSFQNRGTGQQAGLGQNATAKVLCLLVASILFAGVAVAFPALLPTPHQHLLYQPPSEGQDADSGDLFSRPRRWYSPYPFGRRNPDQ